MAVTTWDGSASTAWATDANWDTGSAPTSSDDVIIPDTSSINNPTLGAHVTINSLEIQTNGTIVGGGYEITVDGENSSGFAVDNDGIISGNLDLEINTTTATDIDLAGTSGNFQNLKLNDASCDVTMKADCILDGTLTIAAGQLSTGTGGYGFSNLTVAGNCSIAAGATLEGNASSGATVRLYSLTVNGTYSATGGETIITGETGAGRAVDIVGTFTHNSGTLSIQTPADTLLRWPSSSSAHHLRINDASCIARPTGDNKPLIGGNLTVSAGAFNTLEGGQNHALTVTKKAYIGPNDGTSDTATLTCNASDISIGSGYTSDYSLMVVGGGTFVGGSGTHTLGSIYQANAAGAKITLSSGTTNINAEYGSASKAINILGSSATFNHGGGTVLMNYSGSTDIKVDGGTLALNNLTINHASAVVNLKGILTCAGNLTITAGELDTDSSSNFALTVTGDITNSGTLTSNNSAISSRKLISTGTLSGGGGVYTVTGAGLGNTVRTVDLGGTVSGNVDVTLTGAGNNRHEDLQASGNIRHLTINNAAAVVHLGRNTTLGGDLLISAGTLSCDDSGTGITFDVNGDVSVTGTLNGFDKAISMGSLTIASGGTYSATSGTTTIIAENSSGYAIQNAGTFTHNKGLVDIDFTSPTTTQADNGPYYDFTQSDAATDFYTAGAFEVMNNLYFVGDFEFQNNSHHLIVHGNMTIGDGSTTTRYMPYSTYTCNLTVGGILEVTNGATLTNFSHGTINVGGVRNTGGTM